jgi:quinol-cytochrome oxidoreductase complex cytochrome b subunit
VKDATKTQLDAAKPAEAKPPDAKAPDVTRQAEVQSDVRKNPRRIAFILRRTSPQVRTQEDERVMTYPAALSHFVIAMEVVFLLLVWVSLIGNAPLEGLADPMHTPNPAKAPWYFLGLQELLHYFPPVVAGVLIPGLVVGALVVIPYFNINIEADGLWARPEQRRTIIGSVIGFAVIIFVLFSMGQFGHSAVAGARLDKVLDLIMPIVPTLLVGGVLLLSSRYSAASPKAVQRWLAARPLSFWIMTWFLVELIVLTAIGTFFRGPGWSWVMPRNS